MPVVQTQAIYRKTREKQQINKLSESKGVAEEGKVEQKERQMQNGNTGGSGGGKWVWYPLVILSK